MRVIDRIFIHSITVPARLEGKRAGVKGRRLKKTNFSREMSSRPADAAGNAALMSPAGEGRRTPGAAPWTPTPLSAHPAASTDAPLVDKFNTQAAFQTDEDGALEALGTGGSSARVDASGSGLRLHLSAGPLHQFSPPGT